MSFDIDGGGGWVSFHGRGYKVKGGLDVEVWVRFAERSDGFDERSVFARVFVGGCLEDPERVKRGENREILFDL